MRELNVTDLGARTEIGAGGQGRVYALNPSAALVERFGSELVYKEYDASVRARLDVAALDRLVAVAAPEILAGTAWPRAVVTDGGAVSGFVMRRAPGTFHLRLRLLRGEQKELLGQVQHLLNDDAMLAKRMVAVHDRWRLEFLRDTARTMAALHAASVVVGDLSPMNLLATFVAEPRCFFIDCDAMRIGTETVLPQVETAGWEVPAGEEVATTRSDAYKFALLAVRLFAGDQEARDPAVLVRVGRTLATLAAAGLSHDPALRPLPAAWIPALEEAMPAASTAMPWEGTPRAAADPTRPIPTGSSPTAAWQAPPPSGPAWTGWRPAQVPRSGPLIPPPLPRPPRKHRGRRALGVLLGVALLSGAGVWTVNWANAKAADDAVRASEQAASVQAILGPAGADRAALIKAVGQIERCQNVAGGLTALRKVGQGRTRARDAANQLVLAQLPDGEALAEALREAMTHSLAADQAFVQWGDEVRRKKCTKASLRNAHRAEADQASTWASAAKERVVVLWTPIARDYGHPVITATNM